MVETIQQASKHEIPKSVNDCVKADPISVTLWTWSENVAKWGRILLVLLLIPGVIEILGILADPVALAMQGLASENKFFMVLSVVINTAITAFITYLSYNVLSLLIASLASIVQNTRSHALLKEYEICMNATAETAPKATPATAYTAPKSASVFRKSFPIAEWICHKCGRKNSEKHDTCTLCGTAYEPRTAEEIKADAEDKKWSCPKCGRKIYFVPKILSPASPKPGKM